MATRTKKQTTTTTFDDDALVVCWNGFAGTAPDGTPVACQRQTTLRADSPIVKAAPANFVRFGEPMPSQTTPRELIDDYGPGAMPDVRVPGPIPVEHRLVVQRHAEFDLPTGRWILSAGDVVDDRDARVREARKLAKDLFAKA